MKIGKHFNPKDATSRRNLAAALRARLSEIDLDQARRRQVGVDPETQATLDHRRVRTAAPSLPQLPRPRDASAMGRAGATAGAGKRPAGGPDGLSQQHHRQSLRQDLPGPGIARLSHRRRRPRGQRARQDACPDLCRAGSGCGRVHSCRRLRWPHPSTAGRGLGIPGLRGAEDRRGRSPAADARCPDATPR